MTNTKAFEFGERAAALVTKLWTMFKPKNNISFYLTLIAYTLLIGVSLSINSVILFAVAATLLFASFFGYGFSDVDTLNKKREWNTGFESNPPGDE